jgi:hypothetical protein
MRSTICGLLLGLVIATPLAAQRRNEVTLEGSFVRGALGYARASSAHLFIGLEIGFGFPQFDRTLVPEQDTLGSPDFEEYLHVAPFIRYKPSRNVEIDAGVRAAIADLWPCDASDCWPALFGGVYVQPMIGFRQFKIGSRLTAGVLTEGEPDTRVSQGDKSTGVVSISPFLVRATFPGNPNQRR